MGYSQLWLWPYGYDYGAYPENYKEIQQLAIDASDALFQVHGTVFDPINSADLYPAAGASDDWYKSLGMRFAFTLSFETPATTGSSFPRIRSYQAGRRCGPDLRSSLTESSRQLPRKRQRRTCDEFVTNTFHFHNICVQTEITPNIEYVK